MALHLNPPGTPLPDWHPLSGGAHVIFGSKLQTSEPKMCTGDKASEYRNKTNEGKIK